MYQRTLENFSIDIESDENSGNGNNKLKQNP